MASHLLDHDQAPPAEVRGGVITIGNFDGVHRGHAELVATTCRQAMARDVPALAVTFDPLPRDVLLPDQPQPRLTTLSDRIALLEKAGADHVVVLRTTPQLLHLTAEDFFHQVLVGRLRGVAFVEGQNFGFGRHRAGNVAILGQLCSAAGLELTIIPPQYMGDILVSSSEVRQALLRGAVTDAANLLGRPYRLQGTVAAGQRRGQTLGFPTANLEQVATLIPADGVYAVRVLLKDKPWPAAANIGPNPTFAEQERKVEVHVIGFSGDLYGQALRLDLVQRLRDTRPFGSVADLVAQLRRDVEAARVAVERAT